MANSHSTRRPRKGLLLLTTLALVAVAFTANVPAVQAVGCKVKTTAPSAAATTTPTAPSTDDYTDDSETIPSDEKEEEETGAENEEGVIAPAPAPATKTPKPTKTKKVKTPKPSKKPKSTKAPKATTAPVVAPDVEDDATPAPAPAPAPGPSPVVTKAPTPVAPKPKTPSAAGNATLPSGNGGKCVTGDPTQYISKKYVDWIWENRMKEAVMGNTHYFYNQLMENKGRLRYCIRWDSTNKLPKATASKFKALLERQYAQWNKWLTGYGCWPFEKIEVEIVGVAVRDKGLLDWTDDSLGPIYENILDPDGKPMCHAGCYRYVDRDLTKEACPGKVFDQSLWPTLGLGGGFGYDWGQQVDEANMLSTLDSADSVIVAHEIGHGFGLPDFYEEKDKPGPDMPKMIMEAGASMSVTEGDGWLIRRGWENVRSRWPETSG